MLEEGLVFARPLALVLVVALSLAPALAFAPKSVVVRLVLVCVSEMSFTDFLGGFSLLFFAAMFHVVGKQLLPSSGNV